MRSNNFLLLAACVIFVTATTSLFFTSEVQAQSTSTPSNVTSTNTTTTMASSVTDVSTSSTEVPASSTASSSTTTPPPMMSSTTTTTTAGTTQPLVSASWLLFNLTNGTTVDLEEWKHDLANMLGCPVSILSVTQGDMSGTLLVALEGPGANGYADQALAFTASQLANLRCVSVTRTTNPPTSSMTTVSESSTTVISTVSGTTVSTSTTAAPATTTTTTPTPTIPSVYLMINLDSNTTVSTPAEQQAFLNQLAAILGIDSSILAIEAASSNSSSLTVKITAANASAIGTEATNLDSAQLASLGAASISEVPAPTPTTAEPEKKKLNIPLIAGCAAGGFVLLLILLYVAKKKSSGGSGQDAGHVDLNADGTTFRKMEDELKTHRDRQQAQNNNVL